MANVAMSIGASGLRAMQSVLDLTSNNIANAQTPGYRRQDALLNDQQFGGVSSGVRNTFNPVTATRISQLEGLSASSEVKASNLDTLQNSLSLSSDNLTDMLNSFREALGSAADRPQDSSLRGVVANRAAGLAGEATHGLATLDAQLTDIGKTQTEVRTQALEKMKQLASLNYDAAQFPKNSDIRNNQAQVGRELADLIGGEVTFSASGQATFTVGSTVVVNGTTTADIPSDAGGKLGGLQASATNVRNFRDLFSNTLNTFVSRLNSLNAQGVDGSNQAGGDLFSFNGTTMKFVGSAQGLALDSTAGVDGVNARRMLGVDNLGTDTATMAAHAASQADSAKTEFGSKTASLNSTMDFFTQQEGVDLDQQMVQMQTAQRYYEANAKVIQTQDAMLGTLLNIKA